MTGPVPTTAATSSGFGFDDQYPDLPDRLVWIPLEPALYAPMFLCWRVEVTPAMTNFIRVTGELSRRLGWVRPETLATQPPPERLAGAAR